MSAKAGLAILAKAPIPGLAKTRLIPLLGAESAAALQDWLLRRTVETALSAGLGSVTLWCTPDTAHPEFARLAAHSRIALRQQPVADLGERMRWAIAESPAANGTLVIGTDCPLLSALDLQHAASALNQHDAVITPAEDGGYVLIGMHQANAAAFSDIAWSTSQVIAETRLRFTALGWRWRELATRWDVDDADDFARLCQICPELRTLLPL